MALTCIDILLFYPRLKQKKSGLENNRKRPVKSNGPVGETKEVIRSHILETIEFIKETKARTDQAVSAPRYSFVLSRVETRETRLENNRKRSVKSNGPLRETKEVKSDRMGTQRLAILLAVDARDWCRVLDALGGGWPLSWSRVNFAQFAWRSLLCASRQFCEQFKNGDSLAPDRKKNFRGSGRWISQEEFGDTQTEAETSTPHRTRHFAGQATIGRHIIYQHWRRVEPLAIGWILTSTPPRVWSEAHMKYSCLWLLSSKRHAPGKPRSQPQQHIARTAATSKTHR